MTGGWPITVIMGQGNRKLPPRASHMPWPVSR